MKLGLFALAGPDFSRLVSRSNLTNTVKFDDPIPAAKKIVDELRNTQKVNAVVFFGHQDREADFAMAKAVAGIDLILGTHSHFKGDVQKIEGTNTYFISPFQYLTYLSQVELTLTDGKVTSVMGKLVKLDESVKPDAELEAKVNQLQKDLEADPKFADKFVKIGTAAVELSNENIDKGESVLGNFVMDAVRRTTKAHAAFSTASSFRAALPPGTIKMEDYLTALPYKNILLVHELTGAQVQELLDYSASKIGSDNFSVTSGLKYQLVDGKLKNAQILKDAANESAGYEPLDAAKKYQVTTTDFQAKIAAGYKDIFGKATAVNDTQLIVNDTIIDLIKTSSPVSAKLEGRIQVALPGQPAPVQPAPLPKTGAESVAGYSWLAVLALGIVLLAASWLLRRKPTRS
jgi:5'-nucleotidase